MLGACNRSNPSCWNHIRQGFAQEIEQAFGSNNPPYPLPTQLVHPHLPGAMMIPGLSLHNPNQETATSTLSLGSDWSQSMSPDLRSNEPKRKWTSSSMTSRTDTQMNTQANARTNARTHSQGMQEPAIVAPRSARLAATPPLQQVFPEVEQQDFSQERYEERSEASDSKLVEHRTNSRKAENERVAASQRKRRQQRSEEAKTNPEVARELQEESERFVDWQRAKRERRREEAKTDPEVARQLRQEKQDEEDRKARKLGFESHSHWRDSVKQQQAADREQREDVAKQKKQAAKEQREDAARQKRQAAQEQREATNAGEWQRRAEPVAERGIMAGDVVRRGDPRPHPAPGFPAYPSEHDPSLSDGQDYSTMAQSTAARASARLTPAHLPPGFDQILEFNSRTLPRQEPDRASSDPSPFNEPQRRRRE